MLNDSHQRSTSFDGRFRLQFDLGRALLMVFVIAFGCVRMGSVFADTTFVSEPEAVSVIAHKSVAIDQLSLRELRNIFAMKTREWSPEQAIKVFVLENDHPAHKRFCKRNLNVFPSQLESIWYRKVYTGTGVAPIRLDSEEEMLERIANTPGAVGYVSHLFYQKMQSDDKTKILKIF